MIEAYAASRKYRIESTVTTTQYTWLAVFLGLGVFVSYLLPDQLHALAFLGLTVYYFIYLRFFRVGRITENEIVAQLEGGAKSRTTFNIDQNDEEIVALETKLNASTSRLEAYVLESALFGALSFSGFLQIMASDLVSFVDLENFATNIFNTSRALIHFEWEGFEAGLASLNNKVSLFCLVSVESLTCSIFFLAVIGSRLRFSDVADKVRTSINMAKAYNAKEEALLAEHEVVERSPGRLDVLSEKVNEQLHFAAEAIERVNPVMEYMRYFRSAGILTFLVILITSSLFITSVLGWTFLALVLVTYIYFNYARLNIVFRGTYLNLRIQFIRKSLWFLVVALIPALVGIMFSSTLYFLTSTLLIALGYVLIGLYVSIWLVLAPHVDERFGDISKDNANRNARWQFVKNTLAVLVLFYSIGSAFKTLHLKGADEILMISLSGTAVMMYFVGYYLARIRILGIICGWILATAVIGILFKILHLEGADEMLLIGASVLAVLAPIVVWQRTKFHRLFLRFCIGTFIFVFSMLSGFWLKIEVMVTHRTFSIEPITDVIYASGYKLPDEGGIERAIVKSNWYIDNYGTSGGFSVVYMPVVRNFEYFGFNLLEDSAAAPMDTARVRDAIRLARQSNRILSLFKYDITFTDAEDLTLEADLLMRIGEKQAAIDSIQKLIDQQPPQTIMIGLKQKLIEISESS